MRRVCKAAFKLELCRERTVRGRGGHEVGRLTEGRILLTVTDWGHCLSCAVVVLRHSGRKEISGSRQGDMRLRTGSSGHIAVNPLF